MTYQELITIRRQQREADERIRAEHMGIDAYLSMDNMNDEQFAYWNSLDFATRLEIRDPLGAFTS